MRKPNRMVAGLVALNVVTVVALAASMSGVSFVSSAQAQPDGEPVKTPPFNSAERFNQMVVQLEAVNKKLGDLEKKLSSGISVKVTEMPEVVVKDPSKKK